MKFIEVEFSNFLCYKYGKIKLDKHNVNQIIGINKDENKSNGAGKTTIYLAITEALYSKNVKNILKAHLQNKYTKEPFKIRVLLKHDNKLHEVIYSKNETILNIDGKKYLKGRQNVTNYFEKIMKYDLFTALTYIHPKYHIKFFGVNKHDFLNILFDELATYNKIYDKIKQKIQELKVELKTLEGINIQLDIEIEPLKEEFTIQKPELIDTTKIKEELKEIETIKNKVRQLKEYADKLGDFVYDKEPDDTIIKELEVKLGVKKEMYNKLKPLNGKQKCPTCLREINGERFKATMNKLQQAIEDLQQQLDLEKGLYEQQKQAYEKYKILQQIKELEQQLKNKNEQELNQKLQQIETENQLKLQKYYEQKQLLETIKRHNEIQKEKMKILEQNKKKQEEIEEKKDKIQEELHYLDILLKVFDKNGLIKEELEKRLRFLHTLINKELNYFTDDFKLEFVFKNNRVLDKIIRNNKEYDFNNLSTGEQIRLIIALIFVIKKLIKIVEGIDINIIFFDEIANALDIEGREKLINKIIKENYNIFLITPFDLGVEINTIKVIKEGNISRIGE